MDPFAPGLFRGGLGSNQDDLGFLSSRNGPPPVAEIRPGVPEEFGFGAAGAYGYETQMSDLTSLAYNEMDTSKHASNRITISITANVDTENAAYKYHNVPIFVLSPKDTLEKTGAKNSHRVMSLWHLNAALRRKFLEKSFVQNSSFVGDSRKRGPDSCNLEDLMLPDTISDFAKQIKFAGYKVANAEGDPDEAPRRFSGVKTVMMAHLQGELNNMPNVWGKDVRRGQAIGFSVKWVDLDAEYIRNWDGDLYNLANPGGKEFRAIQVVPVVACQGEVPYGSTAKHGRTGDGRYKSAYINKQDGDTYEEIDVPVVDEMGRQVDTVKQKRWISAHFIPVGKVVRKKGNPSEQDCQEACCSFPAYSDLAARYEDVDIEVLPYGKRFKWVI